MKWLSVTITDQSFIKEMNPLLSFLPAYQPSLRTFFLLSVCYMVKLDCWKSVQAAATARSGIWESVDAVWKCCECDGSQCADSITKDPPVASLSLLLEDIRLTDRLLFRLVSGYCVSRLCTQEDDLHFTPVMQRLQKKNLLKWQLVIRFHFLTRIWFFRIYGYGLLSKGVYYIITL